MTLTLDIRLLGGFSLTYGDRPVAAVNTARSQNLFAYLVLNAQAPQSRQRLAFHLWADSTDTQARTNLRKELSYLRRDLPDADRFLLVEAKTLQWSPTAPFKLDVREFENAVKAAAQTTDPDQARSLLEQALQLYCGDLLPSCEDEWIIPERERLQQIRVRAIEQLIDLLKDQQDYRTAIGHAQQLLRIDALNEATYASLMQLHHLSGDRATALQIYHRCMTLLREELGVDPGATTRKLYEQLLIEDEEPDSLSVSQSCPAAVAVVPSRSKSTIAPLIGRQQEWDLLQQWIIKDTERDAFSDSATEVLLLVGEPGVGKTRLLEELRNTVLNIKGSVLWGQGFAAEMMRPYGIWIDALRSYALPADLRLPPELGFLLPEVNQPIQTPPDRSHLFDAVVQLLAAWANRTCLMIIFDDIQWIDEASTALLHYAMRLLGHLPIRFACIARSQELTENLEVSRVVQALRRENRLRYLELKPLDRSETAALISAIQAVDASELPEDLIEKVFVESGGNPLFALEISRALAQGPAAASTLEALICDRLEQLDEVPREALSWAAALGHRFKPTVVAQVGGYALPRLLIAIEQLERQMIIRPSVSIEDELSYDFAHDIVRQVVYRQFSEPRRRLVHLQIAHQLNQLVASNPAFAGDIAYHASIAGDHELAASTALLAANRSLKLFAYAEAAKLAERSIPHCQSLDERTRIRIHLGLLRICALAGVTGDRVHQLEADVQQLMREANELGLKDEEVIGMEALWILYFNQNNFTSLQQHSLHAAEVSRVASPVTAARLLAASGSCLAEIGREMVRAEALLLEAQSLSTRVGLQLAEVNSGLGSVHYHNGRYAEARPLLQQAWKLTKNDQDHWRGFTYLNYLAMLELEVGDPAAALPYCEEMATVAAKIQGEGSEGAVTAALTALTHYQLQQSEMNAELERAILSLHQVDAKRMLSYVLIGAAEIDLECDRPQLAVVRAETALKAALAINHPSEIALAWGLFIQGLLDLGESERAIAQFGALQRQIDRLALSVRAKKLVDRVMQGIRQDILV